MIKINPENLDKLVDNHYEKLKDKLKEFPSDCKYTLEEVIKAKPEKLDEIAVWYLCEAKATPPSYDFMNNIYKNFIHKKKEYDAYDLAEKLNVNTCPYCNINSTYTVIKNTVIKNKDEKIIRPTFDHFYDKATYPILALSFYNLIPSCHICNSSLKGRNKFSIKTHLNPYSDSFNSLTKFHLKVKDSSFFYDEKGFEIELKIEDERAKNNKETFRLGDLYQNYKDTVLELIQKREIYPDSYIEELAQNYSGLFKNSGDLLRVITGGYIEDKDLNKRPLSKLIKDISEELELI